MARQSLWLDEAFSVYLAAHRFPQIVAFVTGSDAHPPLYYLALHVWLIFGPSVQAMRSLSVLASGASLLVMFLLSRRLAQPRPALLATALMAFSAFQVWYAQEIRMYALETLAVLTAIYALVRAWQHAGTGSWVLFTGAMCAALYLDYSAFYICSGLIIWVVMVSRHHPHIRKPLAWSSLALFLGYLPWLPALWRQLFQIGNLTAWIGSATGTGLTNVLADLLFNRTNLSQPETGLVATLIDALSLALVAAALWLPRGQPAYPLLALWLGWPCALGIVLVHHPIMIARNIMVVQPALFLLLALAADDVWTLHFARSTRFAPALSGLLAICLGLVVTTNVRAQMISWNTTLKEDWRGAAALVAGEGHSGDLALFNAYFSQMPFDYYYHQDLGPRDPVAERGYGTEESLLYLNLTPPGPAMEAGSRLSVYPRVWLVLSHVDTAGPAVPAWLGKRYRLVRQRPLVGVTVQLYLAATSSVLHTGGLTSLDLSSGNCPTSQPHLNPFLNPALTSRCYDTMVPFGRVIAAAVSRA